MRPSIFVFAGWLALGAQASDATEFEPRMTFAPDPAVRSVALTFDACSGAADMRIIDALVQSNAKATIFVTGRWIRTNAAALATLTAHPDLFEIENHGANHVPAVTDAQTVFGIRTAGTIDRVLAEVEGGADAIAAVTARPRWFRGATARYSDDALRAIDALGFHLAGFSLNADQGASLPAAAVARRMAEAKSGDVVIAHINQPRRPSGEGAAAGIRALAAAGVRFVRLDEVRWTEENGRPIMADRRDRERIARPSAP